MQRAADAALDENAGQAPAVVGTGVHVARWLERLGDVLGQPAHIGLAFQRCLVHGRRRADAEQADPGAPPVILAPDLDGDAA
jgi:hypothetical protein